jgi:serine protease Do
VKSLWIAISLLIALAVGGVAGSWITGKTGRSVPILVSSPVSAASSQVSFDVGFEPVVKRAVPAVVNVSSSKVVRTPGGNSPLFSDPFFRRFFGDAVPKGFQTPPSVEREKSLGSGVVVNADGYILTNNHVIDGASDVKVLLSDNRRFNARIVGTDPMTDLAVLKIDAASLPVLAFSDSSKVEPGNFVLAIGNPFALNQTVTFGIVSATGRGGLGIEDYEDFIQTDASINPGNSGGALIDARGDLIGINTAILTENGGGNAGIGFAIPANLARDVMEQILKTGKVTRGYLGVSIQPVTDDLAKALHLSEASGALVAAVAGGSPAAKAGLQPGDIILAMDGQKLEDSRALQRKIGGMNPGTNVKLTLSRNGQTREMVVKLGEMPSRSTNTRRAQPEAAPLRGISVTDLTPDIAGRLNLPGDVKGVAVTNVDAASAAGEAGVQPGDVIEQVNRQPVTSVAEFDRAMSNAGNQPALMLIERKGATIFVVVQPR